MVEFDSPWGRIPLFGDPPSEGEISLLHSLAALSFLPGSKVLVLGPGSGLVAAGLGLKRYHVTAVSDSAREQRLALLSWMELGLEESNLVLSDLINIPRNEYQAVVIHESAREELWGFWLQEARRFCSPGKPIHAVGPPEAVTEWKKWIGPLVMPNPAARVLDGVIPEGIGVPWFSRKVEFSQLRAHLVLHPACPLDVPSAAENLVLRRYPRPEDHENILVWGREGILTAIASARVHPKARVWFVSDSFSAVWSARESFAASGIAQQGGFLVNDRLDDFERETFDLAFLFVDRPDAFDLAREALSRIKAGKELRLVIPGDGGPMIDLLKENVHVKVLAQGEGRSVLRLASAGL